MILAIVPARGGSKRIPRKNIVLCAKKPLLAWTAEAARDCQSIDRTILSTDDEEVARIGEQWGLEVPFMRPENIADDEAPTLPLMQHALGWAEANVGEVEALVLLQPTSPLRKPEHIDEAVALFRSRGAATVVSVVESPHQFHPLKTVEIASDGQLRDFLPEDDPIRERRTVDDDRVFGRNGPSILVVRPDLVRDGELYGNPTLPYEMHPMVSIDIDEPWQLELAEVLLMNSAV